MNSKPREINAEYINTKEDYLVTKLMGSMTLAYGRPDKKKWKAIAFKDAGMAREVANTLLAFADLVEHQQRSHF